MVVLMEVVEVTGGGGGGGGVMEVEIIVEGI